MDQQQILAIGDELFDALRRQSTLAPLTDRFDNITTEDAYHISRRMLERRLEAGEKVTGKKIGVTSKPVQDMLGVFQPDFGFLTDAMVFAGRRRDRVPAEGRPAGAGGHRGRRPRRHGVDHALL